MSLVSTQPLTEISENQYQEFSWGEGSASRRVGLPGAESLTAVCEPIVGAGPLGAVKRTQWTVTVF
jgi:hypothetical protein